MNTGAGLGVLEREKSLAPAGNQTPYHPGRSVVTILTELFRIFEAEPVRMSLGPPKISNDLAWD